MAIFGFAGLSLGSDFIALDPQLPAAWETLSFKVQWRSRHLKIKVVGVTGSVHVTLEAGDSMKLVVRGDTFVLIPKETLLVSRTEKAQKSPGNEEDEGSHRE